MGMKTIYVKDEDLPLFEKAEQLGGDSLSSVIAQALRHFVELKEAEQAGMQEVVIKVGYGAAYPGEAHNYRSVKFIGRELASATTYDEADHQDDRGTDYTLYQTKKGKLLLHVFRWTRWQGERSEAWYQIFNSLSEIKQKYPDMPHQLFDEAAEKLGEEWVEFLDV